MQKRMLLSLFVAALCVGAAVTFLSQMLYVQPGNFWSDKGFPLFWLRVWASGVAVADYIVFLLDLAFWTVIFFSMFVVIAVYVLHWKP